MINQCRVSLLMFKEPFVSKSRQGEIKDEMDLCTVLLLRQARMEYKVFPVICGYYCDISQIAVTAPSQSPYDFSLIVWITTYTY